MQQGNAEKRVAYSPAEFAALFGKHPTWSYRLLWSGKVKAITTLGRILIPASEVERMLESASRYDPEPDQSEGTKAKKDLVAA